MPTYDYRCGACGNTQEIVHSIKTDPILNCELCASKDPLKRMISGNGGGFVVKGDSSVKLWKESRVRNKKNADLELKQMERYGTKSKLIPNVAGQETASWSDASKIAKEAGISQETFKPYIEAEKRINSTGTIDDSKWKKAKEAKSKA